MPVRLLDEKAAFRRMIFHLPPPQNAVFCDEKISERVYALPEVLQAERIFCYYSMEGEADTRFLLARWIKEGRKIALPRCERGGKMDFYAIDDLSSLISGRFGIPEPPIGAALCTPGLEDVAIVPCVACDKRGNRMGRGGGYYDRWLAGNRITSVALCRNARLFEQIPAEEHDRCMDIIVTEKGEWRNGAKQADDRSGLYAGDGYGDALRP